MYWLLLEATFVVYLSTEYVAVCVWAALPGLKTMAELSAKYKNVMDDDEEDDDDVNMPPPADSPPSHPPPRIFGQVSVNCT